jgi:3-methylcrotonyl-CoA carboxylase alpha subunit
VEYKLRIWEDTQTAEAALQEDRLVHIDLRGTHYEVIADVISEHCLHLKVNGVGFKAFIAQDSNGSKTVVLNGIPYPVEDADDLASPARRSKSSGSLPQEITPPMPAVVVRLMVAIGDRVTQGAGVIVVSAMKMETTLTAPHDGTVSRIHVSEGDKVMPGQVLVDIEK